MSDRIKQSAAKDLAVTPAQMRALQKRIRSLEIHRQNDVDGQNELLKQLDEAREDLDLCHQQCDALLEMLAFVVHLSDAEVQLGIQDVLSVLTVKKRRAKPEMYRQFERLQKKLKTLDELRLTT